MPSEFPLITIGIPSYNADRTLRRAIESALAQTWPAVEVIVVDDGSADSSVLVASAFGDRLTLLRTPHKGATHARNLILREAQGAWVQYLDADDYLLPEKLAQQWREAGARVEEAEVLYSPVLEEKEGARRPMPLDAGRDLAAQWLSWELPQTGGCLWRKAALEEIGGWRVDQPCCQEHELYLRALQAGKRFVFTPTPGAIYSLWSESTLCRRDPALVVRTKTKLLQAARAWLEQKKQWTAAHARVAGQACFEMARTLARQNRRTAARYYRERRREGLLHVAGPAAPFFFRWALRLLGFRGAEWLARALRSARP